MVVHTTITSAISGQSTWRKKHASKDICSSWSFSHSAANPSCVILPSCTYVSLDQTAAEVSAPCRERWFGIHCEGSTLVRVGTAIFGARDAP